MWSVRWDVIYHKKARSNTRFFPLSLLNEVTNSASEPILFSCQHALFPFLWTILYYIMLNQPVNLASVFITLLVECFFPMCNLFKSITHALYVKKSPWKVERNVYMVKNFPPKWDPSFMKVGSLLGGIIFI